MSDNFVAVSGNVTRDPELRISDSSGKARATFAVAINQKNADGTDKDPVFVNVTVFGDAAARNAAATLKKGMRTTVVGQLEQYSQEVVLADGTTKRFTSTGIVTFEPVVGLRWATAQVTRTVHENGQNGQNGQPAQQAPETVPAGQPAPVTQPFQGQQGQQPQYVSSAQPAQGQPQPVPAGFTGPNDF